MTQQKITIDNKEYLVADLSEEATIQITNLKVTEEEIGRQESLLAMLKTARAAYARKLGEAIEVATAVKPADAKKEVKKDTKVNGKSSVKK